MTTYRLAYINSVTDEWIIDHEFEVADDDAANKYAAEYTEGSDVEDDWYVLDSAGRNING